MKKTTQHKHEEEMLEQMIKFSGQKMLEEQGDLLDEEDGELELPQELQDSILKMIEDKRAEEQKQTKQLARRTLRRKIGRKLAASIVLVATIGLVGGSVIMSVDAWRIPFLNFVFNIVDEGTDIKFDNPGNDDPVRISPDSIAPTYIPDGFYVVSSSTDAVKDSIVYENSSGEHIVFVRHRSDEAILTLYTNEDKNPININGIEGYLIEYQEGSSVIWGVEDDVFEVYGNVPPDEVKKIAESVE